MVKQILDYEYISETGREVPEYKDIEECIKIAKEKDVIVRLNWEMKWSGAFSISITGSDLVDSVRAAMPKYYPM